MQHNHQTHLVPDSWLDRHKVELGIRLLELAVHPLALVTSFHILFNVITHVLPEEAAANLLKSLITTQMATYIINILIPYQPFLHGNSQAPCLSPPLSEHILSNHLPPPPLLAFWLSCT